MYKNINFECKQCIGCGVSSQLQVKKSCFGLKLKNRTIFLFYFQEEQGIEAVPKQVSFIAALFKSTSGNSGENSTGTG